MNEVPSTPSVPWSQREIKGIGWFLGPVLLNALLFFGNIPWPLPPTASRLNFLICCNLPYYLMVLVIGIRRAREITAIDFLFLVAGNLGIFAIMQALMDLLYTYARH